MLALLRAGLFTYLAFGLLSAKAQCVEFTHGPILGRLSQDGIGVWARTSQPGGFHVLYVAEDGSEQKSPSVVTTLEHDNTGWIHIRGLAPNTLYDYKLVTDDGHDGGGGTFRTLPAAEQFLDPALNPRGLYNFRFEFACGNNQTIGQGGGPETPAFETMLRDLHGRVHFAIQNGDWLYEDKRDFSADQWRQQVGVDVEHSPDVVKIAPTIAGVWENYKVYLERSPRLRAWHANVPSFFTFDDHEILNDVWGAGSAGLRDRRAVFRDIGVQAWYDYLGWSNPLKFEQAIHFGRAKLQAGSDTLVDEAADFRRFDLNQAASLHVHWGTPTAGVNDNALDGVGGDPNAGVYHVLEKLGPDRLKISPAAKADGEATYSIGRRSYYRFRVSNCDFFALDTRSQRQMHDVTQPAKPGVSMLGERQREWLVDGMKKSDADFLFVISSVNLMVPHVGGGAVRTQNKDDAWTVFLDEREALINFWDSLGKPVFVLTGDLHNSFAIKITDRVWEFASGPHNSNNHWHTDEGGRPATGPFQYGPRKADIRWSTFFRNDIPRDQLQHPTYCVVQINNVFNNPQQLGDVRWVAYERPQVIFQYYDGRSGVLLYAEAVTR